MNIERWTSGYKVTATDWYDGQNIYFEVAYYQPGQSLGKPPMWSKAFLFPRSEGQKIHDYLDSIAVNLAAVTDERRMLAWYQGGKISKFCAAVTPEQMSGFFDRIIMVDEDSKPTKEQQDYCTAAGWYNPYVGEKSPAHWYNLLRELQGNMAELDKAVRSDADFYMIDSSSFILDSLFCEYAYIVNLDSGMLEFWQGWQKSAQKGNRYGETPDDDGYYPCRLALEIPLTDTAALASAVPAMLSVCKEN